MNIYQPYEILIDNQDALHLKQSETRDRLIFVKKGVLPLFIILSAWFIIQEMGSAIPMGFNYLIVTIAVIVAIILAAKVYVTEFKVTQQKDVFLLMKTLTGTKEQKIEQQNIAGIEYKKNAGGSFFTLRTKQNKQYLIMHIPAAFEDDHHSSLIKERLQDLLQVPVK